jgi:dihydrofolate synthase/folylpolyglutamate synthase
VPIHQEKGMPAAELAQIARSIGIPADACPDIAAALGRIAELDLDPPPRILITGSLYLAGEVLAANGTPPM